MLFCGGAACTSPCCFAVGRRVLHHVVLQTHSPNTWSWRPDRDHGYYVCGAYLLLTTQQQVTFGAVDDLIWHRQVPLKISIFALRLLRGRLPTRQTWWLEASLPQTLTFGWPVEVTLNWLNTYCYLWHLVRSWIGFSAADSHNLSNHFLQFTYSSGGGRWRRSFLQLIWLLCVWIVGNERIQRLFKNSEKSIPRLLDKVKLYSYRWLKSTNTTLVFNYRTSCPFICLSFV
ncbi:hypothetical protein QL285_071069 [Trifolium repens]|nr:hypothetical protein QL285_071069 [Trifolium repens]